MVEDYCKKVEVVELTDGHPPASSELSFEE
jgi:hypothetical protein